MRWKDSILFSKNYSNLIKAAERLPPLATAREVATVLRCSARYIQSECKAGRMKHTIIAGQRLMSSEQVINYVYERDKSCQEKTKAQNSNGAKIVMRGRSSGLNTAKEDAKAQAQAIVEKLRKNSRSSSSQRKVPHHQTSHLIQVNA